MGKIQEQNGAYDVFVSYRHTQKAAVRHFADYLERAGVTFFFDEDARENFSDINDDILDGLRRSKLVLAWYADDYLQSRACVWEFFTALAVGTREGDIYQRILCIDPANAYEHIAVIKSIAQPLPDKAQWLALARTIKARADAIAKPMGKGAGIQFAGSPWYGREPALFPSWVGRHRALLDIHEQLHQGKPIDRQNRGPVAIYGRGGLGKTMLALEYANRLQACYPGGIVFLSGADAALAAAAETTRELDAVSQTASVAVADGIKSLRDQLHSIRLTLQAERQQWPADNAALLDALERGHPQHYIDALKKTIAEVLAKRGRYLWIVDDLPADADAAKQALWLPAPDASAYLLVTMRSNPGLSGNFRALRLAEFEDDEALALLFYPEPYARAEPSEREAGRRIVAELDKLPLALALAGASIQLSPDAERYANFLAALECVDLYNIDGLLADLRGDLPTRHAKSIVWTIKRSIDELDRRKSVDKAALHVLRLLAIAFPHPLHKRLIALTLTPANSSCNGDGKRLENCQVPGIDRIDQRLLEAAFLSIGDSAAPPLFDSVGTPGAQRGGERRLHALVAKTVLALGGETPFMDEVLGAFVDGLIAHHERIFLEEDWLAIRHLCELACRQEKLLPRVIELVALLRNTLQDDSSFSLAAGFHQICRSVLLTTELLHGRYRQQRYREGGDDSPSARILRTVDGAALAAIARGYYEIPHLKSAVRVLLEFQPEQWRAQYQSDLIWHDGHEDFVATYAIAEAQADLYADLVELTDRRGAQTLLAELKRDTAAATLVQREIAGYALAQIYGADPQVIDMEVLARWCGADEYIERMILGELLINLALNGADAAERIRDAEWFAGYRGQRWNYLRIDIEEFSRIPALLKRNLSNASDPWAEPLRAAAAVLERLQIESKIDDLHSLKSYRALIDNFYRLGNNDELIDQFLEEVSMQGGAVYTHAVETSASLLLLHPLWSVGERATSMLAKAVGIRSDSLQIIDRLLSKTGTDRENGLQVGYWRQAYGAVDAAFNARGYDRGDSFRRAVRLHCDHPNSRVRGICIENLSAIVRESSDGERRTLITTDFDGPLSHWLQYADDCWELELLYLLYRYLYQKEGDGFAPLLGGKPLSRFLSTDYAVPFYAMQRETFLQHIETLSQFFSESRGDE